MALFEDVKGLPNYAKLLPQVSNPLTGEAGVYTNADNELVYYDGTSLLNITQSAYYVVIAPSGGNDSAAIQAALTALASTGGIIQLLAGTYTIGTQITWPATANNIHLRGIGEATVLNFEVTGNVPAFVINASIGGGLNGIASNNTTAHNTSITTTTAANATAFTAGLPVLIRGTDADSYVRYEANEVLTTGDGGTGVIALKHPVKLTLTSVTLFGYAHGFGNKISDLSIRHTAGSCDGFQVVRQHRFNLSNIVADGSGFSYRQFINASLCMFLSFKDNYLEYYNGASATNDVNSFSGIYDATITNNVFESCVLEGNGSVASVIFAGTEPNELITFCDNSVLNSGGAGVRFSGNNYLIDGNINHNLIQNSYGTGMLITGRIKDSNISHNIYRRNANRAGNGGGVYFSAPTSSLRNIVNDNYAIGNRQYGLWVRGTNLTVDGNVCYDDGEGGIDCDNLIDSSVTSNTCAVSAASGRTGILINTCTNLVLDGNSVNGHQWGLYFFNTNSNIIVSNNMGRNCTTNSLRMTATDSNFIIDGNFFSGGTADISTGTGHIVRGNNNAELRTYENGLRSVSASTNSTATDKIIAVNTSGGSYTVTLQTADMINGRLLTIKDSSGNAATNNLIVDTQGAETIDGAASITITANYGVLRLYSDGSNWFSI